MAKPLGPKSQLIRQAITAHPDKGNTELAELLNDADERRDDKIKVTARDVATQRQAMKKAGAAPAPPAAMESAAKPARNKPGRKAARAAAPATAQPAAESPSASPVDLIDKALDLAQQCGGVAALKRLVDRLADVQMW